MFEKFGALLIAMLVFFVLMVLRRLFWGYSFDAVALRRKAGVKQTLSNQTVLPGVSKPRVLLHLCGFVTLFSVLGDLQGGEV